MERILGPIRLLLAHRDLFVVLVCNLLLGLALSFVSPFYSMFGTIEVGMSNWTFGVFMTITSVAGIVLSTLLARWSDTRFSRRSILLLGCACGRAGYAGYAFVRSVLWLTVIGSIGIGISSIVFAQIFAYGREALHQHGVPDEEAPLYMNIYRLTLSLAWTVGPAAAAWVMVRYSYRGIFLACAGLFFALLVTVWLYVPSRPPSDAARSERVALLQLLRRPDLFCYFSAFVLVFVCMTMGIMNLPLMILQSLGGTEKQVGIAYSVAPFFELPFLLLFGLAAARGSKPGPMIRLGVIIGVAYYLLLSRVRGALANLSDPDPERGHDRRPLRHRHHLLSELHPEPAGNGDQSVHDRQPPRLDGRLSLLRKPGQRLRASGGVSGLRGGLRRRLSSPVAGPGGARDPRHQPGLSIPAARGWFHFAPNAIPESRERNDGPAGGPGRN